MPPIESGLSGSVTWKSPSNIAIVKYWGKYGEQLPRNPSVSFTLNNAFTKTSVSYITRPNDGGDIVDSFLFEGKEEPSFALRIENFLKSLIPRLPWLAHVKLKIETENSFPHSSGIASSASGMSALVLCLCDIEENITGQKTNQDEFKRKASFYSRLGSGSACRSIYPYAAIWGEHAKISDSHNEYAIPCIDIDDIFKTLHNDILIVSDKKKSVSSSAGHQLMVDNRFAPARYELANDRMIETLHALKNGDIKLLGNILENEALVLHALMMCSEPSYILMEPETIKLINTIRGFRRDTDLDVFFSLDAGPNIHLMYPDHQKDKVQSWINSELKPMCVDGRIVYDQVGTGPKKLI